MSNGERHVSTNRAELIKQAREDCSRSLAGRNIYSGKNVKQLCVQEGREVVKGEPVSFPLKFFMIRVVIAIMIFVSFVVIDQVGFVFHEVGSTQIVEQIRSDELFQKAQEWVHSISGGKVVDVFKNIN